MKLFIRLKRYLFPRLCPPLGSLTGTSCTAPTLHSASSKEQEEPGLKLTEGLKVLPHFFLQKAKDHRMPFLICFPSLHHSKRPTHKCALLMSYLCVPPANSVGNTFSFSINNPLSPTKVHSVRLPRPLRKNAAKKLRPLK